MQRGVGGSMGMDSKLISRRALLSTAGLGGLSLTAMLTGCGDVSNYPESWEDVTPQAGKPSRGGVLRYGLSTEPVNFEPHVSSGAASDVVRVLNYSALLAYDANGEIVGDLATEYGWESDTAFKVKIPRDVRFHDGSSLTVEDVVFSFMRIMDPDTAATAASLFSDVERVEADGNDSVRFVLKQPNNAFEFALADAGARIVSQKWIESGADPLIEVMGSGPFRFTERVPGVSILVERFDDYYNPELPYLNAIQFTPLEDDYARVTALRTASVDMIDYIPATHVDVIETNPQLRVYSDDSFGFGLVGFVTSAPPFNDKRVRQAVAHSIDREAALQTAFLGQGRAMTGGLMPEVVAPYATELDGSITYDPEKAKHLLKQAGLSNLDMQMITTSSYSVIARPAEAILPALRKSGISPHMERQEWLSFQETVTAKTFPTFAWGTALKYGHPAALSEIIGSSSRWAKFMDFDDSNIDGLLQEAKRQTDTTKANDLYYEVENRLLDEMPCTFTLRRIQGEAAHKYVRGYYHPPKGAWTQVSLRETWIEGER